jgi:biotin-dependent carboxylase-like uncharacterized protein
VIEVVRVGVGTTVQDLGRPGLAHLGVGRSGAADRRAFRLANRLVGNPEGAAALEVTLGGLVLRFRRSARVACAGAPCPVRLAGRPAGWGAPLSVLAGETLELGLPPAGLRSYVAVRGGIDVPPVLGSRATDTLAGLGPRPPAPGDLLPVGVAPADGPAPGPAGPVGEALDAVPPVPYPEVATVRVLPGPRDDWFVPDALAALTSQPYVVTPACDRVGMRLAGPALERREDRELPSEGTVAGALQVPPDGRPILFLADHPVTGGYPVIAVVVHADLPTAAQLRPGDRLRFRLAPPPRAG